MGFFEKIFTRRQTIVEAKDFFRFLSGYTPSFSSGNGAVYESDLIRSALDAHGRANSKFRPVISGSAKQALAKKLMIRPNNWTTWPKFLYRVTQILYAKNTCFIVPVFSDDDGSIVGIDTICPTRWEVLDVKGEPWIRFFFNTDRRAAVELKYVGILTRFQLENELFGEDNDALRSTLGLIEIQKQGITEGIKNSAAYRFMATATNFSFGADLKKERERFDENNFKKDNGGGGLLLFPNTYRDIKQLDMKPFTIDSEQMEIIQRNVFNYFAINLDIIQGKATGDNWQAFYESSCEWLAINLSDVITMMIYTEQEINRGNSFFLACNRLQFMSMKDKLDAIKTFADRGLMMRNELRDILNLSPLPEPYGSQIPARGEYYNVDEESSETEDA